MDTAEIGIDDLQETNGLVGYRIVYLSDSGARQPYYRVITSANKAKKIPQPPASSHDKQISYAYDDASSLLFVTVSPSAAPIFNKGVTPYIGKPSQRILLVNTLFEPIMLDIEMATHDADTISYMLEGSQVRDLDNGLITTFNDEGAIYSQSEVYSLKDEYTANPIYEVKRNKGNSIDSSQANALNL